jgi:uncharacterized membrane protein YkvA (DUF1232 family)
MFLFSKPAPTPPPRSSMTFPHGFLDFLKVSPGRRHHVGDYELEPHRLERFNQALHDISPEAPAMTMDQIASAAKRALQKHADGGTPPFVQSRMDALQRLETLAGDGDFEPSLELRRQVHILQAYRLEDADLIPDDLAVVGLLDDAVLIDVALQLLHDEIADYENFCRFRKLAAELVGIAESATGLTRRHWLEANEQARVSLAKLEAKPRRFVPDPHASLFHIR